MPDAGEGGVVFSTSWNSKSSLGAGSHWAFRCNGNVGLNVLGLEQVGNGDRLIKT